jgi:DNA repair photolyase
MASERVRAARASWEQRRKAALLERAAKVAPPIESAKFDAMVEDHSLANVAQFSGLLSLCPWYPICALPLNINPYRGCTNQCSYCFINQYARGRIARTPGMVHRQFYGAARSLETLERMLQVWQGRRRVESLAKGERLFGEYFARGIPARLSVSTDPFCALEGRFHLSAQILAMMHRAAYPLVVTTKGGRLFDEALDAILALPKVVVQLSLISVDEEVRADYEPTSPPIPMRLAAIERLTRAGVYVSVRMAPVIPDPRILDPEHLKRYVETLSRVGVRFIEFNPLHVRKGIQQSTSNPALLKVLRLLDDELYRGKRLSMRVGQLQEFGRAIVPLLKERGMEYGEHYLGRFPEFHGDYASACHCAKLEQVPGFEGYYKATLSQALLDAKRLWDQHHLPVLMDRSALERYWYPMDYEVPARAASRRVAFREMMDGEWTDSGWFWPSGVVWESASAQAGMPWVDVDATGCPSWLYQPAFGGETQITESELERVRSEVFPERAVLLLDGTKLPFPEDAPEHEFWTKRREAYEQLAKEAKGGKEA